MTGQLSLKLFLYFYVFIKKQNNAYKTSRTATWHQRGWKQYH